MNINQLKCIAIFFIGLAVATETGGFLGIASVLAIVACFGDQERFSNIKEKAFNITFILFLIYVGTLVVSSITQENWHGLRMIMRDFEKIVSFLIIYFFIGKVDGFLKYGISGAILGFLVGEITVFYNVWHNINYYEDRFGGMYGHPNGLGSILELAIPLFLFAAYRFKNTQQIFILSIITLLAAIPCLLYSGSRGAMMAIGAEVIVFLGIYGYRKLRLKNWKLMASIVTLIICVGVIAFALLFERSYDSERILLWKSSWRMFLDYPLLGVGFSNWNDVYRSEYISPLAKEPMLPHPHNLYLYLLSETGLTGFIAYFIMIGGQLKIAAENSCLEYKKNNTYFNIADMFIVVMVGMLVHNLVDVSAILRYYLLIYFFFWGLCCLEFKDMKK